MKETFLVKHAVGGRTFVDSSKAPVQFTIEEREGEWRIDANVAPSEAVDELLKWKDELNVFHFQEFDDRPVVKNWFYVKNGGVAYDPGRERLTIIAASRIQYVPDSFGT